MPENLEGYKVGGKTKVLSEVRRFEYSTNIDGEEYQILRFHRLT